MEILEKETYKVKALMRFLFSPTGRIYDPSDIFEVKSKADFEYLIANKLCETAKKEAKINETAQDVYDGLAKKALEENNVIHKPKKDK